VARPEMTRETMTEILSGAGPDGTAGSAEPGGSAPVPDAERFGGGSSVGVRLVPSWSAELGVEALPGVYADIVEVLADAVHPLRAHQLTTRSSARGGRLLRWMTKSTLTACRIPSRSGGCLRQYVGFRDVALICTPSSAVCTSPACVRRR
jgi:hypothetical protein